MLNTQIKHGNVMKNIISGTLFLIISFFMVSETGAAPTPEETIKAYTDALTNADLEKAYEMVSTIDKPNFSKEKHRENFCGKLDDETCFLFLKRTKYRVKKINNNDNLIAVTYLEKTIPKYTEIFDMLTKDEFKLLITLFKERNNREQEKKVHEELKKKLLDGLKNNSFPPLKKEITVKLLNENGDWHIYFEKNVPQFILEARIVAEKKGREKTQIFMDAIHNGEYEKAFDTLRPVDKKKHSVDDLLKKLEIENEKDKKDWKEAKIVLENCYGIRNNSRKWNCAYNIIFPKNKYHPSRLLSIDTILTRNEETVIFFDTIKYKK